jgi:hypothetical protein
MPHVSLDSTELLHKSLKSIAKTHNIIMQGMYPGMAHQDISESIDFLNGLHEIYLAEFKSRPDATTFEPDIHKVGTCEYVAAEM